MTPPTESKSSSQPNEQPLPDIILDALAAHPAGISEYELIKWIKNSGHRAFQNVAFWDQLSLFQTHFLLFHTLYQLKDRLWQENRGTLEINALNIVLLSTNNGDNRQVDAHDPLRDYYLDLDNLANTTDEDISELLVNFWSQLGNKDKRAAALAELDLRDPVDFTTIKQQHRRLVMQHHPDRGGDKEKLQSINAAMDLLKEMQNS